VKFEFSDDYAKIVNKLACLMVELLEEKKAEEKEKL
jgi:hypothetical protein